MAQKNDLNEIYSLLGELKGGQEAMRATQIVQSAILTQQNSDIAVIKEQVFKTNGRVTKLEDAKGAVSAVTDNFEKTFKTVVGRVVLVTGVVVSAFAILGSAVKAFIEAINN